MKVCNRCGKKKDESEFWKHYHNPDGLRYTCIECCKTYKKEWDKDNKEILQSEWSKYHQKHKKKRNRYCREWRELKHLTIIQVYSDGFMNCSLCGEEDVDVLTIDHINGGGVSHLKTIPNSDLYAWLKNNGFPDGFRVLCWNCQHREKLRLQDEDRRNKELLEFQDKNINEEDN